VSEWTDAQKAAYKDWLDGTSMAAAGSHSTTGNAGSAYSDGYSDAKNLLEGR
jgi:hypothetical protein